jgi:lysophospholipase L1-like esterase
MTTTINPAIPDNDTPTTIPQFQRYLALGDSISIDRYPARALEVERTGLGAASLLHSNADDLFPGMKGQDLKHLVPTLRFRNLGSDTLEGDNLTADCFTTQDVLGLVRRLGSSDERTLVTLTVGGNDLLSEIGIRSADLPARAGDNPVPQIVERLRLIIDELFRTLPNAALILGTVYDPTDGSNSLPGWGNLETYAPWLHQYNEAVREIAAADPRIWLADIHQHFFGHGLSAPPGERWYWSGLIIEPNHHGASEVRRLWIDAIAAMAAKEVA